MKLFRFETTVENTTESFVDWYEGRTEEEAREVWSEDIHRYGLPEDKLTVAVRLAAEEEMAAIDWKPAPIPSPQEIADSIIAEIKATPRLMMARDFSELHDYCDANCLGDSERLLDLVGMSQAVDILNESQPIVTAFLTAIHSEA